jgi:hypothetical protein
MYKIIERSLIEAEKRQLGQLVSKPVGPFQGLELKLAAHATAAVIFGVLLLIALSDMRWNFSIGPVACLIAYLLYLLAQARTLLIWPLRLHRRSMARYLHFRDTLNNASSASVKRILSSDVVQILHDEGSFYLFSIGANSAFWTSVQASSETWPNTDFEIFSIQGLEDELGPICHGKRLKPRRVFEFSDYFENFDFEKLPVDGLINSSIDSFLQDAAGSPKPAT